VVVIFFILGTTIKGILTNRHVTTRLLRILTKQATSIFKILTH